MPRSRKISPSSADAAAKSACSGVTSCSTLMASSVRPFAWWISPARRYSPARARSSASRSASPARAWHSAASEYMPGAFVALGGAGAVAGQGEHLGGLDPVAEALVHLAGPLVLLEQAVEVAGGEQLAGLFEVLRRQLLFAAVAVVLGEVARRLLVSPEPPEHVGGARHVLRLQEELGRLRLRARPAARSRRRVRSIRPSRGRPGRGR